MESKHKKIAVCIGSAYLGGSFNSTALLASQLSRKGFDTTLIVTGNHSAPEMPTEARNVIFPNSGISNLSKRIANLFEELVKYDALLFTESIECDCVASGLPSRIPVVHIVRNTFGIRIALRNSRFIDAYVAVSPVVKEFLNVHRCPVDPHVIGNSTAHENEIQAQVSGRRDRALRVVYLGRLIQFHKNVMILPRIASMMKHDGIDCEWTIAGDGSEKDALRSAFGEADVPVRFVKLSHRETGDLLAKADYAIVPSKFEAFGLVVIEAIACGCIPICSDAPSFNWILGGDAEHLQVQHGDDAKQYATLIQKLEADPDLRKTVMDRLLLRQRGKFSPQAMSDSYTSLLTRLWDNPNMRGGRLPEGKFSIPFQRRPSLVMIVKTYHRLRHLILKR